MDSELHFTARNGRKVAACLQSGTMLGTAVAMEAVLTAHRELTYKMHGLMNDQATAQALYLTRRGRQLFFMDWTHRYFFHSAKGALLLNKDDLCRMTGPGKAVPLRLAAEWFSARASVPIGLAEGSGHDEERRDIDTKQLPYVEASPFMIHFTSAKNELQQCLANLAHQGLPECYPHRTGVHYRRGQTVLECMYRDADRGIYHEVFKNEVSQAYSVRMHQQERGRW